MALLEFDFLVLKFFNQPTFPFNYISFFLTEGVYILLIVFACIFYKRKREKFYHFLTSFFIGFVFVMSLKYLVNRPRPFIAFPNEFTTLSFEFTPSFPSFHSFIAFFLINFILRNFSATKKIIIFYLLLIPFFLLYDGVHYPTDLLVGAIIGYFFPILISEKLSSKMVKKISSLKKD